MANRYHCVRVLGYQNAIILPPKSSDHSSNLFSIAYSNGFQPCASSLDAQPSSGNWNSDEHLSTCPVLGSCITTEPHPESANKNMNESVFMAPQYDFYWPCQGEFRCSA